MKKFSKNLAFTLAEVLITLGIIGVVAAMTIPTLISNTESKKYPTQFKKTLSTIKQASLMAQAMHDVDFGSVNGTCVNGATDNIESNYTICALLNATLSGATYYDNPWDILMKNGEHYHINANDTSWTINGNGDWHAYQLADGSMFIFGEKNGGCTQDSPCSAIIDVNGTTLPNTQFEINSGIRLQQPIEMRPQQLTFIPAAYAVRVDPSHSGGSSSGSSGAIPKMTDVFPVYFYDTTVIPATPGSTYALTGSLISNEPVRVPVEQVE